MRLWSYLPQAKRMIGIYKRRRWRKLRDEIGYFKDKTLVIERTWGDIFTLTPVDGEWEFTINVRDGAYVHYIKARLDELGNIIVMEDRMTRFTKGDWK